ncbi:MAG: hypothetical protein ACK4MM_04455 [Fervidobacterium sp.]
MRGGLKHKRYFAKGGKGRAKQWLLCLGAVFGGQKVGGEIEMDEKAKRKMIYNYFKPFPKWAVIMIIIGLPLLLAAGFGIILIGIGIVGLVLYNKGKPADRQMDEWLREDLVNLGKRALNKMNIDDPESIVYSVAITGPRLWDVAGANIFFKKGKDNILRFTPININIVNCLQNHLLAYTCILDFTTGNPLNESTEEYFYKDIVSVSTRTESRTVNSPKIGTIQMNEAETFTLTTSGGTSFSILLRDPTLIKKMGGGEIPVGRAEEAVQEIRKILRSKKI